MTETVRETRRADELKVGDWLREDENGALNPNEVKAVFQYPTKWGLRVHLTTQVPGRDPYSAEALPLDSTYELMADADLAELRDQAERAEFTTGLREFADWLDANPWAPIKRDSGYLGQARIQIDLHGGKMDAKADVIARVREFAVRMGVKIDETLDDRTDATVEIGSVSYSVIAWHKDGRPAEPKPLTISDETIEQAGRMGNWNEREQRWDDPDPFGLAYTRADSDADDPTPVSGARVEPHTGGVLSGIAQDGHRLGEPGAPVDETLGACSSHWHDTEVDDYPEKCPSCGAVD